MNKVMVTMLAAIVALLSISSCKKDKTTSPDSSQQAKVNLRLTDGPGSYDALYLDIKEIEFKQEGRSSIVLYPYRPGLYDILRFRNGLDTLLVNATVPVGKIEQIRLILGSNSYIVDGGVSYPLGTPSAQESGVKLNLHQTLEANVSYDIWLDFDAGKSIVKTGSDNYKLKPVIRAYSILTNGRIEGYVFPLNAFATVYVSNGVDEYTAIPSSVDGRFVISGLPEGNYHMTVEPGVPGLLSYSADVNVAFGAVSSVGTITLLP